MHESLAPNHLIDSVPTTRRAALARLGGGAVLAALASVGPVERALAQDATPVPDGSMEGLYVVLRTRKLKPDTAIDELTAKLREGLVPIIRSIPGFVEYYIVQNRETLDRTSVSIFLDKEGADESTKQAGDFLRSNDLADLYVDVDPTIVEGEILLFADRETR